MNRIGLPAGLRLGGFPGSFRLPLLVLKGFGAVAACDFFVKIDASGGQRHDDDFFTAVSAVHFRSRFQLGLRHSYFGQVPGILTVEIPGRGMRGVHS